VTLHRLNKPNKRGPYRRKTALFKVDRRSVEGRLMDQHRADLLKHLGGPPSVTQRALVERAVLLALRIAQLDERLVAGTMTILDASTYLAWVNSYRRVLATLGLEEPAADKSPSLLSSYLESRHRDQAAA
jgi:hypothetical protein